MRGGGWDFGAVGGNEVELSSVLDLLYFTHFTLQCPHQAFRDRQLSFTIEHSRNSVWSNCGINPMQNVGFFAVILVEGDKNLSGKIRRGSKVVRVSVGE